MEEDQANSVPNETDSGGNKTIIIVIIIVLVLLLAVAVFYYSFNQPRDLQNSPSPTPVTLEEEVVEETMMEETIEATKEGSMMEEDEEIPLPTATATTSPTNSPATPGGFAPNRTNSPTQAPLPLSN